MYRIDEKLKRIVEVSDQPKILYKFIIIPFCGNKNILESDIEYQESINGYIQDISTTKLDSNNNTIYTGVTHQNIKLPKILKDIPESNKIYGTIDIDINNILYAYISESQIDNVTNNNLEKKEQIINFIKNYYDVNTKLY